jgi:tyrosyl-tRNA synthetase
MIAKESVKSRLARDDVGLSFTEFSYMLLQAYDFLRLYLDQGCTLQLGGSDQWGNITVGTELVRKSTGAAADALTSPLLLRADGTKFAKSATGEQIWLDRARTSPFKMYQFLLNADDTVAPMLLRYLTFLSHDEIRELDNLIQTAPKERRAQRTLARDVVTRVHGEDAAKSVEHASVALFGKSISLLDEATLLEAVDDAPSSTWSREELLRGVAPVDLIVATQLASSKAEAHRLLDQGGAYLNNVAIRTDEPITLDDALHGRYIVLRRGQHLLHLIVAS